MEMDKARLADAVVRILTQLYPKPKTNLVANTPWELLVATVLSAQCTDARVNQITPQFFSLWPNAKALLGAELSCVENVIRSCGFYHAKATHLLASAKILVEQFNGEVPKTLEQMLLLPGVARKTANVVLFGAYGINAGFAVDTHVKRISFRLGLTNSKDPKVIEKDLMALFAQSEWGNLNHRMVWFGRQVCKARKPICQSCAINEMCPRIGVCGTDSDT